MQSKSTIEKVIHANKIIVENIKNIKHDVSHYITLRCSLSCKIQNKPLAVYRLEPFSDYKKFMPHCTVYRGHELCV